MVGLTAPIIGVLTFVFLAGSLSVAALIAGFAITLGLAGLLTIPFRWYCESLVRGRTRRLLIEQLGGEGPYPCSVELRPEGGQLAFQRPALPLQLAPPALDLLPPGRRLRPFARFLGQPH